MVGAEFFFLSFSCCGTAAKPLCSESERQERQNSKLKVDRSLYHLGSTDLRLVYTNFFLKSYKSRPMSLNFGV